MQNNDYVNYYLLSPLEVKADRTDGSEYITSYELEPMPAAVLADKLDAVRNMIKVSLIDGPELINLLDYIDSYHSPNHETIKQKTAGFMPDVQMVNGQIMGVGHLYCKEELSRQELDEVRNYICGQYSDGWGEGFEQQPVPSEYGNLYISFWSPEEDYSIDVLTRQQWDTLTRPEYLRSESPER